MSLPYEILSRKRAGEPLAEADVRAVVAGAADGSWSDAQLGSFLMAAAIRGLDADETRTLTYCALYDNGVTDPAEVKRRSTSPRPVT